MYGSNEMSLRDSKRNEKLTGNAVEKAVKNVADSRDRTERPSIHLGVGYLLACDVDQKHTYATLVASLALNHQGRIVMQRVQENLVDPTQALEPWLVEFISMLVFDCLKLENPDRMLRSILPLASPHQEVVVSLKLVKEANGMFPLTPRTACSMQNAKTCEETAQNLVVHWVNQPLENRIRAVAETIIYCLLKFSGYDARIRSCLGRLCQKLEISNSLFQEMELKASELLQGDGADAIKDAAGDLETIQEKDATSRDSFTERINEKKKRDEKLRKLKIGAAAVIGGTLVAVTGGLAAPAIGAGLATVGGSVGLGTVTAGLGGFLGTAGGVAFATTVFGATGAGLNGYKMSRRIGKKLNEFWFEQISNLNRKGLSLTIGVHGWITDASEVPSLWENNDSNEFETKYTLVWERKILQDLGQAFEQLAMDQAVGMAITETLKHTTLAAVVAAVAWPTSLLKVSSLIDNSWSVAVNRANLCGEELAIVLMNREKTFGKRPVTLYGNSLGALAIFVCLLEIAKHERSGDSMHGHLGIVDNVYFERACISRPAKEWEMVRRVVAGRLVNAYSTKDWVLSFLYRGSGTIANVAGLSPVQVYGVENVDVSDEETRLHYPFHNE